MLSANAVVSTHARKHTLPLVYLVAAALMVVASLGVARDRWVWLLEVFPVLVGLVLLVATYRRFPLTNFLYFWLVVHSLVLCMGAAYTYAEVPFGFWLQSWLGLARNHFDRIGHFAQGFMPALVVREVLRRTSPLQPGKWLAWITVSMCLAISALYELFEFSYTVLIGKSAETFLGAQGDAWDAQWDMTMALVGASVAVLLLGRYHDKRIARFLPGASPK